MYSLIFSSTSPTSHTLDEVEDMFEAVGDNQMYRTLIAVAMYAGLRRAEIRGLQWGDIEFDSQTKWGTLTISRTFWEGSEGGLKTNTSKSVVPMIPQLTAELEAYRKERDSLARPESFVFEGPRPNMPYDISAIGNKMMKPVFIEAELKDDNGGELWHGWHSYRRGLGNELDSLEVSPKVAASILRHKAPVTSQIITEQHYMKKVKMPLMIKAMQKFSAEVVKVRNERRKSGKARKSG
jgi:integrase